jgi:hypothetical protein
MRHADHAGLGDGGCVSSASSTSRGYTFDPPEMYMSDCRPVMNRKPRASRCPRSPVWNQPPAKAFSFAVGFSK